VAALAARGEAIAARTHDLLAGALREAIDATGGLPEADPASVRDAVEYLVRRGRMTPEEAPGLVARAALRAAPQAPLPGERP
jgi:hypothetical protein